MSKKDMSAEDLADLIIERRLKRDKVAYDVLRQKCIAAVNDMSNKLETSSTVDLDGEDVRALGKVSEELRALGYKFAYVEMEGSSGEITEQKLRISVQHLCKMD